MIIDFNKEVDQSIIDSYINSIKLVKKDKYHLLEDALIIKTPKLYIPFAVEEYYSTYTLKLQLRKQENKLLEFINKLEEKLNLLFNNLVVSNLRFSDKFDPLLSIKLTQNKKVFTCNAFDMDNQPINILDLKPKTYCKCELIIDTVWKFKNKYYFKIKLKNLFLQ